MATVVIIYLVCTGVGAAVALLRPPLMPRYNLLLLIAVGFVASPGGTSVLLCVTAPPSGVCSPTAPSVFTLKWVIPKGTLPPACVKTSFSASSIRPCD